MLQNRDYTIIIDKSGSIRKTKLAVKVGGR